MEVMKFTEEEWLAERSRMRRAYNKAVRRQKMMWQKFNGLLIIGIVIASWSVWNLAGHILISVPVGIMGTWLVFTDRLLD